MSLTKKEMRAFVRGWMLAQYDLLQHVRAFPNDLLVMGEVIEEMLWGKSSNNNIALARSNYVKSRRKGNNKHFLEGLHEDYKAVAAKNDSGTTEQLGSVDSRDRGVDDKSPVKSEGSS